MWKYLFTKGMDKQRYSHTMKYHTAMKRYITRGRILKEGKEARHQEYMLYVLLLWTSRLGRTNVWWKTVSEWLPLSWVMVSVINRKGTWEELQRAISWQVLALHRCVHLRFTYFVLCKFNLKQTANKYWILANDISAEVYWCLQFTLKCIENKTDRWIHTRMAGWILMRWRKKYQHVNYRI
jgi:hypothetical protein